MRRRPWRMPFPPYTLYNRLIHIEYGVGAVAGPNVGPNLRPIYSIGLIAAKLLAETAGYLFATAISSGL